MEQNGVSLWSFQLNYCKVSRCTRTMFGPCCHLSPRLSKENRAAALAKEAGHRKIIEILEREKPAPSIQERRGSPRRFDVALGLGECILRGPFILEITWKRRNPHGFGSGGIITSGFPSEIRVWNLNSKKERGQRHRTAGRFYKDARDLCLQTWDGDTQPCRQGPFTGLVVN